MKIGVIEVGKPPVELRQYGSYPQMMATWLAPLEAQYEIYDVEHDALARDVRQCDAWLITGSKCGVYESHTWIAPLEHFIRDCANTGVKMIGICFGHQLIAQALGGVVVKSDKGWGIGVHEYTVTHWTSALGESPKTIRLQAYHQDQVIQLPKDCQLLARSDFCHYAALYYENFALTFQGHPEFACDYAEELIRLRKGRLFTDEFGDAALATVTSRTDNALLARSVQAFLSNEK